MLNCATKWHTLSRVLLRQSCCQLPQLRCHPVPHRPVASLAVEAILDDALPDHLTLFDIAVDPPALWEEQRTLLISLI